MEVRDYACQTGLKYRFLRLFLPLLIISTGAISIPLLTNLSKVQATPVSKARTLTYSGTFTSGNSSASIKTRDSLATPTCKPDSDFQSAGPISTAGGTAGLIAQTDPAYIHTMYGYSANQLANLSRQCSLLVAGDSEPFINAYTSYWIGWQFDYQTDVSGACRVSNAAVMLHIRQALPGWADYSAADASLQRQWQNYMSAVTTHENGHVKLVRQSAQGLLLALQAIKPADCAQIEKTVDQIGNDYLTQLAAANQSYDLQTQHGAAQSAIVP